jgi:hypothetical protein
MKHWSTEQTTPTERRTVLLLVLSCVEIIKEVSTNVF